MTYIFHFLLYIHTIAVIYCNGIFLRQKHISSNWLQTMNSDLQELNRKSADLAWKMMTNNDPSGTLEQEGAAFGAIKTVWKNSMCDSVTDLEFESDVGKRMVKLLCRGPRYTQEQARDLSELLDNMSEAYSSSEVCVPANSWPAEGHQTNNGRVCLKGEPDLEEMMSRQDLSPEQLHWVWKSWHDTVGVRIKRFYPRLVTVLNEAAIYNGYTNIGEAWREELEMSNLENDVRKLYNEIQPFYAMLHAVVRHALFKKYGSKIIDPTGAIPIHLLGNMWGQDWSALSNLIIPKEYNLNLNEHIIQKNWTINDMVLLAEDMYMSLGLPGMTKKFWKYSTFERNDKNSSLCHGTAANMFDKNDYRILLCAKLNMDDFYVIHHEMGHIEYYMSYKEQPAIFQDGTNSAFQESIGDSIMTGVMVPHHLHRLALISDQQLLDENLDIILLLQQALTKIPQIPFALLVDQYRWRIFDGKIKPEMYNQVYWYLNKKLRGIVPPEPRNENYFDAGAKFHIPDNTPYIRYFLSAILQIEMFKGMCELTVFGKFSTNDEQNVPFPLHRCDLYGSKNAGSKLKKMMATGASKRWTETLKILTNKNYISAEPLLEYYKPIQRWLENYILKNNITVGW